MKKLLVILLPFALLGLAFPLQAQDDGEFGIASFYHDSFQGKETAYGVKYDKSKLTAAHRLHPFGTMLRVTRLDNNRSVEVKVIDKGPYKRGRVIDLSKAAAQRLNLIEDGLTEVKVEVISRGSSRSSAPASSSAASKPQRPQSYEDTSGGRIASNTTSTREAPQAEAAQPARSSAQADAKPARQSAAPKEAAKGKTTAKLVGKDFQKYGLYKIAIEQPSGQGFAVQVASMNNADNVFRQVADLQAKWFENILVSIEEGRGASTYKVMLGPFDSEKAADNYRKNLQKKHKMKGFVVDLKSIKY